MDSIIGKLRVFKLHVGPELPILQLYAMGPDISVEARVLLETSYHKNNMIFILKSSEGQVIKTESTQASLPATITCKNQLQKEF